MSLFMNNTDVTLLFIPKQRARIILSVEICHKEKELLERLHNNHQ